MGYPVQSNAPKFTVGTDTYCISAHEWPTPMGQAYRVGVYIKMLDGSWNSAGSDVVNYMNAGDVLNDVRSKGGTVKYIVWLKAKINAVLQTLFSQIKPPTGEPQTDAEARAFVSNSALGFSIAMIDGVPSVQ